MRLLAYTRVSSDGQARHGHSLADDQPERLEAYCRAYGYELVGVISDQVSARKVALADRPGGAELLARLEAGDADGVIVVKLDRLFRDLLDGLDYFRDALYPRRRKGRNPLRGWQVVSLAEHIDTSTASGRHMLKFSLLEADAEADRTSERTTHAIRGLRRRGRLYGHAPYGCIASGGTWDAEQGRMVNQLLERDPALWPVRERIVAMRTEQKLSLRAIAGRLADEGIQAPAGGAAWSPNTLNELIRSHGSLIHLPVHGADADAAAPAAPETADSASPGE
jgi:DNA invertase Pin-like site-specific DNA recombinase